MKNTFVSALAIGSLFCMISPAWALFEEDKAVLVQKAHLTLVEAVEKAISSVQGKAVSAELEKEDDKTVFEVKILDETGNLREIYVDANSGNVLKIEKD